MKYFALLKGLAIFAVIVITLSSKFSLRKSKVVEKKDEGSAQISQVRGTVIRIQNADRRTFFEVQGPVGEPFWVSTPERRMGLGDCIAFEITVPEHNYTSRGLGMTLPVVYFTSYLFHEPKIEA